MELGKNFARQFLKVYSRHKWPRLDNKIKLYPPKIWTKEMFKIIDKAAERMKLERKKEEMLRIDRAYYSGNADCPLLWSMTTDTRGFGRARFHD